MFQNHHMVIFSHRMVPSHDGMEGMEAGNYRQEVSVYTHCENTTQLGMWDVMEIR